MQVKEKIDPRTLKEGSLIILKGTLDYSVLSKDIAGPQLEKRINENQKRGISGKTVPHRTITLREVTIIPEDPSNITTEERYLSQKLYKSKQNPQKGAMFNMDFVTKFSPRLAETRADGSVNEIDWLGELQPDQRVTLVLRVYKPKSYSNKGLSIDAIITENVAQFFSSNSGFNPELEKRGIKIIPKSASNSPNLQDEDDDDSTFTQNDLNVYGGENPYNSETANDDTSDDHFASGGIMYDDEEDPF